MRRDERLVFEFIGRRGVLFDVGGGAGERFVVDA
jgi:hypothetical protein